ncbi:hypothetical protein ACTMTJ_41915 [Phytohabitans sp. LJ34]|uniref:hypothetical protein n=1 Tax=Phytohabitans sp. LJ34 TaxID=3452217 RepID=UPI003F8B15DD
MNLSRVAVLVATAAVVLAPVQPAAAASAQVGWNESVAVAPAIFENPFDFAHAIFEDPFHFAHAAFEDPFGFAPAIFSDKWEAAPAIFSDKWEAVPAIFADPLGFVVIGHGEA